MNMKNECPNQKRSAANTNILDSFFQLEANKLFRYHVIRIFKLINIQNITNFEGIILPKVFNLR